MTHDIEEKNWIPSFALECILYNVNSRYFLNSNKRERCIAVLKEAYNLILKFWSNLLESNRLLFVENINGLTKQKALILIVDIRFLIEENLNLEVIEKEIEKSYVNEKY